VDGLRERHDAAVCEDGVFDECVLAIRAARQRGFRVTTNTTFFTTDSPSTVRQVLDFLNDELRVDQMMISPAYAYQKAPDQANFLPVEQTRKLFAEAFAGGRSAAGVSTTPRSSWISWRARPTSTARPGRSRASPRSAGSAPAT
jgi:MoaA/NifB/PqqE/SkfB family radical SAM enzyme